MKITPTTVFTDGDASCAASCASKIAVAALWLALAWPSVGWAQTVPVVRIEYATNIFDEDLGLDDLEVLESGVPNVGGGATNTMIFLLCMEPPAQVDTDVFITVSPGNNVENFTRESDRRGRGRFTGGTRAGLPTGCTTASLRLRDDNDREAHTTGDGVLITLDQRQPDDEDLQTGNATGMFTIDATADTARFHIYDNDAAPVPVSNVVAAPGPQAGELMVTWVNPTMDVGVLASAANTADDRPLPAVRSDFSGYEVCAARTREDAARRQNCLGDGELVVDGLTGAALNPTSVTLTGLPPGEMLYAGVRVLTADETGTRRSQGGAYADMRAASATPGRVTTRVPDAWELGTLALYHGTTATAANLVEYTPTFASLTQAQGASHALSAIVPVTATQVALAFTPGLASTVLVNSAATTTTPHQPGGVPARCRRRHQRGGFHARRGRRAAAIQLHHPQRNRGGTHQRDGRSGRLADTGELGGWQRRRARACGRLPCVPARVKSYGHV